MVRNNHQPEYIFTVRTYIEANYGYPLDAARIASEIARVSTRTLQTAFLDAFGITMQQLHLETRLNNAKYLLSTTNKPIKEIAAYVGYTDTSAFDHFFHKMTNKTPEQYRRENS